MPEMYSKTSVRAIGKVLLMKLGRTPIKTYRDDEKWPLFVKEPLLFWWSAQGRRKEFFNGGGGGRLKCYFLKRLFLDLSLP